MTQSPTPRVGFITYDLQEFTIDCLERVVAALPARLKAYPLFGRVDRPVLPFPHRPSAIQGRFFSVHANGSTPEGFTSSVNVGAAVAAVRENDVVVLFGLQGATALLAATLARLYRRKLVSVNQTLPVEAERRRRWWVRGLKRYLLALCDWHIVQSPVSGDVLNTVYAIPRDRLVSAPFEAGGTAMRQRVVQSTRTRETIRAERGWGEHVCVFLFVGTLLRFKGVPTALAATAQLRREGRACRLVLVGPAALQPGEPSLEDYCAEAARLGIADVVELSGPVPLDVITDLYRAADVLLLPTEKDCFPKVLAEAAMAGLPHITTTSCGALGAIVEHGRTGRVVPPADAAALAGAMRVMSDGATRAACAREAERQSLAWCDPRREAEGYASAIIKAWSKKA